MTKRSVRIIFCFLVTAFLYGPIPFPGKLLIRAPLLQGAWMEGDLMVPVSGRPGQEQAAEFPGGPRTIHKVMPVYPDELRSQGIEGYEDVLGEIIRYNLKPRFVTTYVNELEKIGLAFPSRAEIRVDYPAWDSPGAYVEKIRTSVRYDSYMFFIVDTTSEVKK